MEVVERDNLRKALKQVRRNIAAQSSALPSAGLRASPAFPVAKASPSWIGCALSA
jgi:hypothetical protein